MNILVYAIGNPGRQDDGLGALLADTVQSAVDPDAGGPSTDPATSRCDHTLQFDANYQLNVEDAEAISHFDVVVFVDASVDEKDAPFRLSKLEPETTASFSTHSVNPGGVLALCHELYKAQPKVYMLAVRGYEWEFNGPVTEKARQNADEAATFLLEALCGERGAGLGDYSLLDDFVS